MTRALRLLPLLLLSLQLATSLAAQVPASNATAHHFGVENGHFALDGRPFQIISGEMHTPRIPRAEWRNRLKMAHAMGLNTVTAYVFWNEHELQPGVFDFTGQHDVAEFIREAQQEGLYVILRPGPYVCAEWEFGGYPAWLLKDHSMVVRSSDPKFMAPARRWLMRLGQELAPLQIGNGGPILAVQVENEYGSFGKDHAYMKLIHQALIDAGFTKAMLYTADGPEELHDGALPELPAVINFGPGGAMDGFTQLRHFRPNGPFMSGEYWAGWFDHWGEQHHTSDAIEETDEVSWMLGKGFSLSLYMFHGGTNFGWMNGANIEGKKYQPTVTSYDYDAPLDESGRPTKKYFLYREIIAKATGITPPQVPVVAPLLTLPAFALPESVSLWKTLPKPILSEQIESMEDVDQAYGYILYRTAIKGPIKGELVLDQLHDYAQIFANGKLIGSLDRRLEQDRLSVDLTEPTTQLDILVENSGRINFTVALRGERKGITQKVTLVGKTLTGWQIYPLPFAAPGKLDFVKADCSGVCLYRGSLQISTDGDTYLDTSNFSKGFVWVNGQPLGRIWKIGPQRALFLPGAWLHTGSNEVIVLDLDGAPGRVLSGRNQPLLDATSTPQM